MFCVDFKRLKKRARDPESYERMRIELVEFVRKDELLIALVSTLPLMVLARLIDPDCLLFALSDTVLAPKGLG